MLDRQGRTLPSLCKPRQRFVLLEVFMQNKLRSCCDTKLWLQFSHLLPSHSSSHIPESSSVSAWIQISTSREYNVDTTVSSTLLIKYHFNLKDFENLSPNCSKKSFAHIRNQTCQWQPLWQHNKIPNTIHINIGEDTVPIQWNNNNELRMRIFLSVATWYHVILF